MEPKRTIRSSRYMQILAFLSVLAAILMIRLLGLTTVEQKTYNADRLGSSVRSGTGLPFLLFANFDFEKGPGILT